MFATIIQSQADNGYRQTVLVPQNGEVRVYDRTVAETSQRGIAGSWVEVTETSPTIIGTNVVLGQPVAIAISPSDLVQLLNEPKPTTLLQKLVRAVQGQVIPTGDHLNVVFSNLYAIASSDPLALGKYSKVRGFSQPTQTTPASQPVAVVADEPELVSAFTTVQPQEIERVWANLPIPKVEGYIERVIDGMPETEFWDKAIANGDNVLLSGHAGVGKTESVENLASRLGLPFHRFEMHRNLNTQVTEGRLMPKTEGGWRWHYSRLATAVRQPSVILLNELSRTSSGNATLFLGILEERKLMIESLNEEIDVHPECIIIADQNVGRYYVGTQEQDKALLDRFNVKIDYEDDPAIESKLIPSPALLEIAQSLRYLSETEPSKHRTRVGLRMLKNFVSQARVYNFQFAVNRFVANFAPAERESVLLQFEARYENIASELNVPVGNYSNL